MWNIPANTKSLSEGLSGGNGGVNGANQASEGNNGMYVGPCPSTNFCDSNNRTNNMYEFVVYAVDGNVSGNSVEDRVTWLEGNALDKDAIGATSDAAATKDCKPKLDGKTIYDEKGCAACHGATGVEGGFGKSVKGKTTADLNGALDRVSLMASFKTLTDEERDALGTYMMGL